MNDRSRDQVRSQERDDKLRALGKLSAGLAHELNNPAAAIARAAQALATRAAAQPAAAEQAAGADAPTPKPCAAFAAPGRARPAASPPAPQLRPWEQSEREDALADWLTAQGVPDGYRWPPACSKRA